MGRVLDGFPTWSQNADPDPTLGQDPFATTMCGEEVCSIVQFAYGQGYTTETQVRLSMPGHSSSGVTSAEDLMQYLSKVGIRSQLFELPAGKLKAAFRASIDGSRPLIVLGTFVSSSVNHWVLAIGYGNDHAIYVDPWYGQMRCMHWSDFLARYRLQLVQLEARRLAVPR